MEKINDKRLKELEIVANSFITSNIPINVSISNNLKLYYDLAKLLADKIPKLEINDNDFLDITKKTPLENIDIVKDYYKYRGIDFDFDKAVNNGMIEMIYYDNNRFVGKNYYKRGNKLIDTCNNGLITDSIVLVHEMSHLRNQPDNHRGLTNDLLTEALAFGEELVFMDYLKDLGYEKDVELFKKSLYKTCHYLANRMISIYKMVILYKELSSLSRDSYIFCYKNDEDYDKNIEVVNDHVSKKEDFICQTWYILGYYLATYMYFEYKKDYQFYKKIQELNDAINEKNVLECLSIIGLTDLGEDDKEIVNKALDKVAEELSNIQSPNQKRTF